MSFRTANVRASGTTFAQLQAGGIPAVLDNFVATNAAIANPTVAATATATGGGASGGTLTAGTYFITYTWFNGFGETTVGTSESSQLTVASTNIPRVTIPALPTGAAGANIYLTAVGGSAGTEVLLVRGVTATTYDISTNTFADLLKTPPTVNTTAASSSAALIGRMKLLEEVSYNWVAFRTQLDNFLSGYPVALGQTYANLQQIAAVVKVGSAALDEIMVLLDANPGTLGRTSRTFP